jgi:hypothetical protein
MLRSPMIGRPNEGREAAKMNTIILSLSSSLYATGDSPFQKCFLVNTLIEKSVPKAFFGCPHRRTLFGSR